MTHHPRPVALLVCALALPGLPAAGQGQGTWDAMLTIQSFPSPYFSDWDQDPNIGSLTLMNHTSSAESVRIFFTIADAMNRVIASGTSDPEIIGAGAVVIYDSPYAIAGSTSHDAEFERIASRTGRLPEGDYTACASAADESGFVLAEACAHFFIAYPDPPLLLAPGDGEELVEDAPLFQWTPVQVPLEYQVTYAIRIVEVLDGQEPGEALAANIPVHEDRDAFGTTLRYPLHARLLEPGRTYAWSVQAVDQNGYAASANDGRSEIWTFRVEDPSRPPPVESGVRLILTNAEGSSDEGGTGEDAEYSLAMICALWDHGPPEIIRVPMDVPAGFIRGVTETQATLYRDERTRSWALVAERAAMTASHLLYGECPPGSSGPLGGLQWIAVRRSDKLGDLLADGALDHVGEFALRFGVVVLSLYETRTALPETFTAALGFLDYNEIAVQPGLNAFGVLDLPEGPLWPFFQFMGYTTRHLELQGFLGLNQTWSVGGRFGRTEADDAMGGAVEITGRTTILLLRAALPKRTLRVGHFFETAQAALEFTVEDSVSYYAGTGGPGTSAELDLTVAVSTTLTTHGGVEWKGSLGLVFMQERPTLADLHDRPDSLPPIAEPCWRKDNVSDCIKGVLTFDVDNLQLGRRVYLSGLRAEFELNDGLWALLETRDLRNTDWNAVGTADLGVGDLTDLAQVVVGFGRSADAVRADATPPPDGEPPPERPAPPPTPEDPEGSPEEAAPHGDSPQQGPPSVTPGAFRWGARVALGNMTLVEMLRLLGNMRPDD